MILLQAYFHVFLVFVLAPKTLPSCAGAASHGACPALRCSPCLVEQKRLREPWIPWAVSAGSALHVSVSHNACHGNCVMPTSQGRDSWGWTGKNTRGWGFNPSCCCTEGSPASTTAPGEGALPGRQQGHAETWKMQEQPLTACDSPFAPGLFGRQVAKSDTRSVGQVRHSWQCVTGLLLCFSNWHLSEIPAGWCPRSWTEEGRTDSPTDKKRYWKSRFSLYSQLSLAIFFFFMVSKGTVKSCWKTGNPSLSENGYSLYPCKEGKLLATDVTLTCWKWELP